MSRAGWLAIGIGVGVGALLSAGCGSRGATEEGAAGNAGGALVTVRARAVETRAFEDVIEAHGEWRAGGELPIVAPFAGAVDAVRPGIGDAVKKGEVLAWLVPRESDAALRGAELLASEAGDSLGRAEARRALRSARAGRVRVPLVAPSAGVVTRRSAEAGTQVAEGSEILALVARDAIRFEVRVGARDAARLRLGQVARVLCEGRPPEPATLERVLPSAGAGDQAVLAWLAPATSPADPQLGRFGTARIRVGAAHRAPAVPDSALVEDDLTGQTRVAVAGADGRAHWQAVEIGAGADGWHEIRSPALPAGTRVIVEGQHGLPDGTRVRLAP
jgi:multidrug efflux pump subunit AcrA (membrane-fusion protein)